MFSIFFDGQSCIVVLKKHDKKLQTLPNQLHLVDCVCTLDLYYKNNLKENVLKSAKCCTALDLINLAYIQPNIFITHTFFKYTMCAIYNIEITSIVR